MTRFSELRGILNNSRYFKVVCGAGNEDPLEIEKLSLIYTLAGAIGIDVSANVAVVQAAVQGIDKAFQLAPQLAVTIPYRPFINVSVAWQGIRTCAKALLIKNCARSVANAARFASKWPLRRVFKSWSLAVSAVGPVRKFALSRQWNSEPEKWTLVRFYRGV
jgi:hypothetical protein